MQKSKRRPISGLVCMAATLALMAALVGCCPTSCRVDGAAPPRPARINHLAFFKLKDAADAPQLIADCDAMLSIIPGVMSYYCGTHLDTGRANVDGDYDVGFYVGFESEEAYRNYVNHPNHIALVENWKPRWEWIRVNDVLDETP